MPINHAHLSICIVIPHSGKDSHKSNKMPSKMQEDILILHDRLVSLLNSNFTADRWRTNTHFNLLVCKCHAQQNVLLCRPRNKSLYLLNWIKYICYRSLNNPKKALSMQVNTSRHLEAVSSLEGGTVNTAL